MIDHKAEAEKALVVAMNVPERDDGTCPEAVTAALIGQVDATLYLAEQQRIGNLIAKQTEIFTGLREGESLSQSASDLHRDLEDAIREGLGI